jgi:hypothetical protein
MCVPGDHENGSAITNVNTAYAKVTAARFSAFGARGSLLQYRRRVILEVARVRAAAAL